MRCGGNVWDTIECAVWGNGSLLLSSLHVSTSVISIAGADEINFKMLQTLDLPYQCDNNLMMHDSLVLAVDVSNDETMLGTMTSNGAVCIWKISDGKLLQKLERAHGGIVGAFGGGDKGRLMHAHITLN